MRTYKPPAAILVFDRNSEGKMRLLNVYNFQFERFLGKIPPYAILSHRWSAREASSADVARDPLSCTKVHGFALYVREHLKGVAWIWIDSCCVDQSSTAELSEAINSMFDWYRNAVTCVAFLPDVAQATDLTAFAKSVWFTRGWTLQELLAARIITFLTSSWEVIGHKGDASVFDYGNVSTMNLEPTLAAITQIPEAVIRDFERSYDLSVPVRLQWMDGRDTLRPEDKSYAMFGIFGVTPGANYGEGEAGAKERLLGAIASKDRLAAGLPSLVSALRLQTPSHNVPFLQDPSFVTRKEMITLQDMLARSGTRVALVGLGGVGKSQLAIEYCYRSRKASPGTWVFWIHASNAARVRESLQRLADEADIPGRDDVDADLNGLVSAWLRNDLNKWFIVLDNIDDADYFFAPPSTDGNNQTKSWFDYFPICAHGSILYTTRRQAVAERLVDQDNVITLRPSKEHAVALLRQKLGQGQSDELENLAAALEYMPLAIAQAAAYIRKNAPLSSPAEYLKRLEKNDKSKAKLLEIESAELRRDRREAKASILLTWQISFDQIRETRPSAADMLSLMCFYDFQGIPQSLIRGRIKADSLATPPDSEAEFDSDSDSDDDASDTYDDDIAMLRDYSFITVTQTDSDILFQMHRLVQLATHVWLKASHNHHNWEVRSIQRLDDIYPYADFARWGECRLLGPHVRLAAKSRIRGSEGLIPLSSLLRRVASFMDEQGQYADSEAMARRSMDICMDLLGKNHPDTLSSMETLELAYVNLARYREAEEIGKRVLDTRTEDLGPEHPDTLRSLQMYILVLSHIGYINKAAKMGRDLLDTQIRVLGPENSDTLTTMNNLASMYTDTGQWDEAVDIASKLLETRTAVLGREHPNTMTTMNNLSNVLDNLGRHEEAEEMMSELLELRVRLLGENHPNTLITMNNMASVYRGQRRWADSEELDNKVWRIRIKVLGPEHRLTLTSMNNLQSTYIEQKRWEEAEDFGERLLNIRIRVIGPDHPETLTSMNNLAVVYYWQGRYDEAEELMGRCVEMRNRLIGPDHPYTKSSVDWMSSIRARKSETLVASPPRVHASSRL